MSDQIGGRYQFPSENLRPQASMAKPIKLNQTTRSASTSNVNEDDTNPKNKRYSSIFTGNNINSEYYNNMPPVSYLRNLQSYSKSIIKKIHNFF